MAVLNIKKCLSVARYIPFYSVITFLLKSNEKKITFFFSFFDSVLKQLRPVGGTLEVLSCDYIKRIQSRRTLCFEVVKSVVIIEIGVESTRPLFVVCNSVQTCNGQFVQSHSRCVFGYLRTQIYAEPIRSINVINHLSKQAGKTQMILHNA